MTDPVVTDTSGDHTNPAPGAPAPTAPRGGALRSFGRFLRRWRAPLVLLPLLGLLAYAALVGGRMLWEDLPESTPAARSVTCWDGSESPRTDCPVPTGAAGLRWVFPSFRPSGRCVAATFADDGGPRPTQYDCTLRLGGAPVTVSYSQRSTLTRGLSYFAKRYDGIQPRTVAGGERLLYRDAAPRADGSFEVTASYARYPFAVTVGAPSLALADRALADLVDFRPAAFVLVRPYK